MMGLATVFSRAAIGLDAPLVSVEVNLGSGLPFFSVVGLPQAAVRESKDRVRAAIQNVGYEFPASRITVNLAPADLKKTGGRFDLPIAIGILVASGQLSPKNLADFEFVAELSLDGSLRGVAGVLTSSIAATKCSRQIVLSMQNAPEAALCSTATVLSAAHLRDVCSHLQGAHQLPHWQRKESAITNLNGVDLLDIRGQAQAKRALEIAAAGGHSLLMCGPPGSGKTMLARRLPGLLPELCEAEALECAALASLAGRPIDIDLWRRRPFRSPHHTASKVALIGGASLKPGEVSLAHNGVLFLDELPEFGRVLEVLREPLESGCVEISRAAGQVRYPAIFQLIAAMNPCPCGYRGDSSGRCRCTPQQIQQYRNRVSGPLLDRIDMHVAVPRLCARELTQFRHGEKSATIAERVSIAQQQQIHRSGCLNARLTPAKLRGVGQPAKKVIQLLHRAVDKFGLSARTCDRVLRVARSIADLQNSGDIKTGHLSEALALRLPDT